VLHRSTGPACDLSFAGPLSGRKLMGIARVVPNPAIRSGERAAAPTGPVHAFSAALVYAAVWTGPARRPSGFGGACSRCGPPRLLRSLLSSLFSSRLKAPFGERHGDEDGSGVLPGFCRGACQYCNLLQTRFAACAARAVNENRPHVGSRALDPRR
jgi:hypothetical protein